MAISLEADVFTTALWPQSDIRDPLGVFGFRLGVTGDATAGSTKVLAVASAGIRAAYVYTLYSVNVVNLTAALSAYRVKARILTNWPNVDVLPGVQGYGSTIIRSMSSFSGFTPPIDGVVDPLLNEPDRFILIFDPRPTGGTLPICELELNQNVDLATWSFEGWGYYWDRSILQAPGGPRHPGSS